MKKLLAFWKAETVLCISAALAALSMLLVPPDAAYLGYIDPRVLQKYVREEGTLSLEEAVHKMTALPASVYRLEKGLLREGADADLAVFSPGLVQTRATYAAPRQLGTGFDYVFVNGMPAVDHDRLTGARTGSLLRRARF